MRICFGHYDDESGSGFQERIRSIEVVPNNKPVMKEFENERPMRVVPGKYWFCQTEVKGPRYKWLLTHIVPERLHCFDARDYDEGEYLPELRSMSSKSFWSDLPDRQEDFVSRLAMATVFPYVHWQTGIVDNGASCKACNGPRTTYRGIYNSLQYIFRLNGVYMNHVYSRHQFLAHVRYCSPAQALWKRSGGGTKSVYEQKFITRGGYFNE
jgi:hypothetical protein